MMSAATVSVNPVDGENVDRIKIIETNLDQPVYYIPIGYSVIGTLDGSFSDYRSAKVGKNYPKKYSSGKKIIEVVLNGSEDFKNTIPIVTALKQEPMKRRYLYVFSFYSQLVSYSFTVPVEDFNFDATWNMPLLGNSKIGAYKTGNDTRTVLTDIILVEPEVDEIEYLGKKLNKRDEHLTFNGKSRINIPEEAQSALIDYINIYDENGSVLTAEVKEDEGVCTAYKLLNGLKVEEKAYGLIKLSYIYESHVFKISYEANDFYVNMEEGKYGEKYLTNNKDNVEPCFYHVKCIYGKKIISEVFELRKKVDFITSAYEGFADQLLGQYVSSAGYAN